MIGATRPILRFVPSGMLRGICLALPMLLVVLAGTPAQEPEGQQAEAPQTEAPRTEEQEIEAEEADPQPSPPRSADELEAEVELVQAKAAAAAAAFNRWAQTAVIFISIGILVVIVAVLLGQMSKVREKLAEVALKDPGQDGQEARKLFFQMPLGVPDGSVRSAIAVLIVIGALLTLIAAIGDGLGFKVPEALTGVFGTILGFYFGRSGSVETAQAASAAQSVATVAKGLATAQQAVTDSNQALQSAQLGNFAELSKKADLVVAAAEAVLAGRPPGAIIPTQALATGRDAIVAAQAKNSLDDLTAAFDDFVAKGPLAEIVNPVLSALGPVGPLGLSPLQGARALAAITPKLSPDVARLWVARASQLPFRAGLISPTIDDGFATRMLAKVPAAALLMGKAPPATATEPAPTATDLMRMALQEDGASLIAHRFAVSVEGAEAVVTPIVAAAIDEQLASQLPAEVTKPFGDASKLLAALSAIQSSPAGLEALDILLKIAREARDRGIDPQDLLPSG